MTPDDPSTSGDQSRLDQAIAEFLRAESAGQINNRDEWLARYPECAAELAEFFDDRERVNCLAEPVRIECQEGRHRGANSGLFSPAAGPLQFDTVDIRPEPPLLATSRYRPLAFHARGGMGEIWLAEDEYIGRKVAVKKLRSGREAQRARFVVEAQITGQLEHPSIVPLHDLGVDDAGHPFYIMKFIQGRKLKDAIAEFHSGKRSPDCFEELAFRRLLEIFVDICNVVAYAHNKGVLHRDIKPDNVMLGAYGETMVVDWGLAKVIGQPDEDRGSYVRLSGNGSTATQDGAIVGSPYYMSPEGAEGHPEAVDQISDVYLLGATLYEILTGKPPREGSSSWELIDLARRSRPASPRKADQRIPRTLEAICLKAMAFEKKDRYETPLRLAEDVERYLAGAPTDAYAEPLPARVLRWLRRHRRIVFRCIAAACVVTLALFAMKSYRQALALREREKARGQSTRFLRLADEAQFYAANVDAVDERVPYFDPRHAQASGNAALAIASLWGNQLESFPLLEDRSQLRQSLYELLLLLARTELMQRDRASDSNTALKLLAQAREVQSPSRGYHQLRRESLTLLGEREAAEREQELARHPTTPVTAHDHFLAGELLRTGDADSAARMLESDTMINRSQLRQAIDEYRQAIRSNPRHFWARYQLGRCLLALGQMPEAIETLSSCIALEPDSPWAHATRGLARALAGQSDALEDLDKAIQLDPNFQPARLHRGIFHWQAGNAKAALADFDAVLAADTGGALIEAAFYRGQVLLATGEMQKATADFTKAIESRPDFRPAYWLRATCAFRLGDLQRGLADVESFLALESARQNSSTAAESHLRLGKALRKLSQQLPLDKRSKVLEQATSELQAAIDAGPATAEMWKHLGAVHELQSEVVKAIDAYSNGLMLSADDFELLNMRGWAYVAQKNYDQAEADFAESLRLAPSNAEANSGLGFVWAELGRYDEARKQASIALLGGGENHLVLHNIACIYGLLSDTNSATKVEHENIAIATLNRAVALSRQNSLPGGADELTLIRNETAFPAALRSRPEFQRLLQETDAKHARQDSNLRATD